MRESRRRSVRDASAVGLALLLHALALAVVARVATPLVTERRAPLPPRTPLPDEIAVALVDAASEDITATATAPPLGERAAEMATAEHASVRRAPRELVAELAPTSPEPDGSALTPPAPTAVPALSGAAAAQPIDLGIGPDAWRRWLPPAGSVGAPVDAEPTRRAPIVRAPPASSTGGLVEGLEAADRGRIVGPSGRVVAALEQAAHGEGATAFGVASFAVTVLRTGGVEVTLRSNSTGDPEWQRVAERAARDLAKNAPTIPPSREGAHFVVDLVAEVMLPDGRPMRTLYGPRFEATPPRLRTSSAAEKDMLERNPTVASGLSRMDQMRANVELPGVYIAQNGKVCRYRFGLSALGPLLQGGCELENLGVKPQRVVHAQVRAEELF
jgi:hypothetical protein